MEYRLNKFISGSGYCSRREADRLIEEGRVKVNGRKAVIGMRVLPGQTVQVNGELIKHDIEPVYIAFNKPVGVVSTTDPLERDNIVDFIRHEQRIFPIGRLDKDSQGLILLTNDGDIVNKILRCGNNHKKEYIVRVDKPLTPEFLTKMSQGVPILDRVTRGCEIEQINPFTFKIGLVQGLNRQIRRMCEYFDYDVLKLERIQVLNIKLGSLGQGNWRSLNHAELEDLFDLLEDSDKTDKTSKQGRVVSNKRMNRELEKSDLKRDYRKANSVAQSMKKSGKKSYTGKPYVADAAEEAPVRKKGKPSGGLRVGKSRVKSSGKPTSPASKTKR